jgi:tRNA/rRNA methyltransferase
VTFPVNPAFASLNLAQAVLLVSYEWMAAKLAGVPSARGEVPEFDTGPAPKAHLLSLMQHLERALEPTGYFRTPDMRPTMVQNLRAVLQRSGFTSDEVDLLHGVIGAFERQREKEVSDG